MLWLIPATMTIVATRIITAAAFHEICVRLRLIDALFGFCAGS